MNQPNTGIKHKIKTIPNFARGFTLIEMLVTIGLFTIVMLVATASVVNIVNADKKAKTLKSVTNNLNFAMEDMVRNLRMGDTYHCGVGNLQAPVEADELTPNDCPSDAASETIVFKSASDSVMFFSRIGSSVYVSDDGGSTFTSLTAPEVIVNELLFYVDGSAKGDNKQPRVFILVRGEVRGKDNTSTAFDIQTLVSQRLRTIDE
ncbi:MAG: type II secretion system protein [bacterium]|nr:type II secretion system protein [bacterium]